MHIIHIASEIAKAAKAGGLADVVYGLSKELSSLGHQVEVILPKYDIIDPSALQDLRILKENLSVQEGENSLTSTIWTARLDGITLYLVEPHHPSFLFSRGTIYGCSDDIERFLYFSKIAMEFLHKMEISPEILHLHDWPAAATAILAKKSYPMQKARTLLTLHNVEHQGKCSPKKLEQIGIDDDVALRDPKDPKVCNLLKGGIIFADALSTVSPSYKQEITEKDRGYGLEKTLQEQGVKLQGIINGIDGEFWNPQKDPFLVEKFSTGHVEKQQNKEAVQEKLALEKRNCPLVICISRLVTQKSPELIAAGFEHILASGGQCVILGSTHDDETHTLFSSLDRKMKKTHPGQGAIVLKYNEPLSHLLYAAADMLMIPSLFEPCGLTQMIALRYGTIPIARKTGGLKDSLKDISEEGYSFLFDSLEKEDFLQAVDRALALWKQHPKTWKMLIERGMGVDFTWKSSTSTYCSLYRQMMLDSVTSSSP